MDRKALTAEHARNRHSLPMREKVLASRAARAVGVTVPETGIRPGCRPPPRRPDPAPIRGTRRQLLRRLGMLGAAVLAGCGFSAPAESGGPASSPAPAPAAPEPVAVTPTPAAATAPAPAAANPMPPLETQAPTVAAPAPAPATTDPPAPAPEPAEASLEPIADEPACVLTPQATEGPFYLDTNLVRQNIVEGRPGIPLQMAVRVVRADGDCEPLEGAFVDIWHADASGVYSGYPGQLGGLDTSGQTFLRGIQATGADGVARFETIYPGWYPGRTVHIHFKVHYQHRSYVTSQFYFPDQMSDRVYERPPYSDRPNRTARNDSDSVLRGDPAQWNLLANITEESVGYAGSITIGVVP